MVSKISNSSTKSIVFCLRAAILTLLVSGLAVTTAYAQVSAGSQVDKSKLKVAQKKKKEKKQPDVTYPLFNGLGVGLDLWGGANYVLGSDFLSTDVQVMADLKHRYFPTVELGVGSTDTWNDHGTHYKSTAPYFRIGMDYNMLYNKKHGNMILLGLRYGFSSFSYDIQALGVNDPMYGGIVGNPSLEDDVWGGSLPYDYTGMKGSMHWAEFCFSLRGNIWKQIDMSLGLRIRFKLSGESDEHGEAWYVPGFGKQASSTMGVSYSIIYKIPFKQKNNKK